MFGIRKGLTIGFKAHRGKGAGKTAGLVEAEQTAEGGGIGRVGD